MDISRIRERIKNMLLYNLPGKFDPKVGLDVALAEALAGNAFLALMDWLNEEKILDSKQTSADAAAKIAAQGIVWSDPEKYAAVVSSTTEKAVIDPPVKPVPSIELSATKG